MHVYIGLHCPCLDAGALLHLPNLKAQHRIYAAHSLMEPQLKAFTALDRLHLHGPNVIGLSQRFCPGGGK